MAEKYTPGPWRTDPEVGNESVLGPDDAMVADCAIFLAPKFGKRTSGINQANARLVAAAPDMIEVLKWADRRGGLGFDVHERIRAVIAKVEAVTH